jgi:hypothetical protein
MAIAAQSPNLFELTDEDTKITYAPGAFGGAAQLHYAGPMGQHSFDGDQIHEMRSPRGLEISVMLDNVSRFNTTTLTVFLPELEFGDGDELSFRTIGIQATRRLAIAGGSGAEMTSEALALDGLAKLIQLHAPGPPVAL